jgi:hypothetical protein
MIYSISVDNVNEALAQGLRWLANRGEVSESRNGPVTVSPCPVVTCYNKPTQRVLFSPLRDANPFFHLMEALWMLTGSNDIAFPRRFNKRFQEYSDDGETQWGAYGWRWRVYFGYDQLEVIVNELRSDHTSRRAVLGMWDPNEDLLRVRDGNARDVPCNTNIFFRIRDNLLDMQINNRSNDVFWGAYGANAVHMSVLQEYLAFAIGVGVGRMYQASWNFHGYNDVYPIHRYNEYAEDAIENNHYAPRLRTPTIIPTPLLTADERPDELIFDCHALVEGRNETSYATNFVGNVAYPMVKAWEAHKAKDYPEAEAICARIRAADWRRASLEWIQRRHAKWSAKGGN